MKHGLVVLVALVCLLNGCSNSPSKTAGDRTSAKSADVLSIGMQAYREGKYPDAIKSIQRAVDLGLGKADEISAHKYLAFSYCVTSNERACADEFRKLLTLNPAYVLEPAEVGHPLWGPVFKSTKAKYSGGKN